MRNLVIILVILLSLILLKSCSLLPDPEESHSWGCTRYITIKYSEGRDTTYRELFVASSDVSTDETKTEILPGGITKTTIKHITCTHLKTSP